MINIERISCDSIDLKGYGVVHYENRDYRIPNLLPGEIAQVDLYDHGYGKVIAWLKKSDQRLKAPCSIYHECGGCLLQHIPYETQLEMKTNYVKQCFAEYYLPTSTILPTIGMKNPYHYRNKVQMVISEKGKRILSGFYEENTHRVVNISDCYIQDEVANSIVNTCKALFSEQKIKPYDEDKKTGLIRHIMVKRSQSTEQVLVVIVTSEEKFPGRHNFVQALRTKHPNITSIVQNINPRKTSVVLGDFERVLFGKGYIVDEMMSMKFMISSKTFYQVNSFQTEKLFSKAMELAKLNPTDTLLDAYSGVGTIGLLMSSLVKKVYAVEINPDSIKNAIQNAKLNQVKNVYFAKSDAVDYITKLINDQISIDVVVVDPPRMGLDPAFVEALKQLNPKKIIYISCDPSTLARDVSRLDLTKYEIKRIQPIDMFAQTNHVETVCLLARK